MKFSKLTPVLPTERIEPCLDLWEKRLGFKRLAEVPEGDHLGFVLLACDGIEIMYQTWTSIAGDIAPLEREARTSRHCLFIEVSGLDAIERSLAGIENVAPKRTTFYGMTEVIIRDAAGHVVLFAERAAKQ